MNPGLREEIAKLTTAEQVQEAWRALKDRLKDISAEAGAGLKVGARVSFTGRGGRKLTGVVRRIMRLRCEVLASDGRPWAVSTALLTVLPAGEPVTPAPAKRPEAEVIADINGVYNGLSPENLCCDGEASRSHINRRRAELNRQLRALFAELGREVDETEALRLGGYLDRKDGVAP